MSQEDDWNSAESDPCVQNQIPPTQQYEHKQFIQSIIKADDLLIDIDIQVVGKLIGKYGMKVKSLKKASGAFISIIDSDTDNERKIVRISGNKKSKEIAQKLINEIITSSQSKKLRKQQIVTNEPVQSVRKFDWNQSIQEHVENNTLSQANLDLLELQPYDQNQLPRPQKYKHRSVKQFIPKADDLFIAIKDRIASKIVGKNGMTIKSLKEESGAYISIIKNDNDKRKSVRISGDKISKELAQKLINDIIIENDTHIIKQELVTNEPVQSLRKFDWNQSIQEHVENNTLSQANLDLLELQPYDQNQLPHPQKYKKKGFNKFNTQADDLFIAIEARIVGKIIGKNGMIIKSLKEESGAYISIIDSDTDNERKIVKISGNKKSKEIAQKLINEIIIENDTHIIKQGLVTNKPVQSIWNIDLSQLMREHVKNGNKMATLKPIIKDFYKENPEVSKMTNQEVECFRLSKNNIMVTYINKYNIKPIPKPISKFSHVFKDYPEILNEIQKQKFEIPSPLQCQAWPIIMSGHDLIAIAQTGTGKTLAYLLPAIIHINFQSTPCKKRKGPSILILVPTRKLVLQIESEVHKYNYKGIKVVSIYDIKRSSRKQKETLHNIVEIVIATPNHLNDFVNSGTIDLSDVTFLILDGADSMLNLGFEPQICNSLLKVRLDRQTVVTSKTWSRQVKHLAKSYTTNPIQVSVGSLDLITVNTVKQDILLLEDEEKESWLYNFLKNCSANDKVIIFVNKEATMNDISVNLCMNGYNVESIHTDYEQRDREKALKKLHNDEVNILIATNIASSEIDIDDIKIVINYDFINDIEEYLYRVDRTGGAVDTGLVITLITRKNWSKMTNNFIKVMEKSGQDIPQELHDIARNFETKQESERVEGDERSFKEGRIYGEKRFSGEDGFECNRRNNCFGDTHYSI